MAGQYDTKIGRLTLAAVALVISALALSASAADDWNVDGENGELRVHGELMEGACQLDMTSAWQQVSLGSIDRHELAKPGDRTEPVAFKITLRRCSRTGGDQYDLYTGTSTQDAVQPVVTLTFTGVSDPLMPSLLAVTGIGGAGLMLIDPQGRRVIPGERGEPLMLVPGDNTLTYTVAAMRTPAPLTDGPFRAVAGFEVSYD